MEVAGPLGTLLGLAQWKRASPRGEAGTSHWERGVLATGLPGKSVEYNSSYNLSSPEFPSNGAVSVFLLEAGIKIMCHKIHSSVLAWRIPGTVEPGGLPSMGSHRVGHD